MQLLILGWFHVRHVPRLKFIQDQKSGEQMELEATIEQLAQERRSADIREA